MKRIAFAVGLVLAAALLAGVLRPEGAAAVDPGQTSDTVTVSGIVTHANKKELIGREGVFQVVDNGKRTDFASIINFHEPGIGTNCTAGEFDLVPVKGDFTIQP